MLASLELETTIVRNGLGTLENLNHFCRFVLKCGMKAGEKTTPGPSSTREL
jgi:hypothetical protein